MDKCQAYPTGLSEKQWEQLRPLLPQKRIASEKARKYINAILYVLRIGGSWRMLPHDFPPYQTVYSYFRKLCRDGSWERINHQLRGLVRRDAGRESEPSLLIRDSQCVKTTEKGDRAALTEASW